MRFGKVGFLNNPTPANGLFFYLRPPSPLSHKTLAAEPQLLRKPDKLRSWTAGASAKVTWSLISFGVMWILPLCGGVAQQACIGT